MKNYVWKKIQIQITSDKPNNQLKIQQGATLTFIPDLNIYILFGAIKNSQQTNQLKKQQPKKNPFSKGGFTAPQKQNTTVDIVYVYNPVINKWKVEICTGKLPNRRINHYTIYQSPYLFIYGGIDKKIYGDIFALNCKSWVWKKLFLLQAPPSRLFGQLISMKQKKYLIGGTKFPESNNTNNVLNDIWALSFANINWQITSNQLPGAVWSNIEYNNINNQFIPIKYFTANSINDSIYIFGGFNQNNEAKNTEYIFNINSLQIKVLQSKGIKPSARGKHKSILIKRNLLAIYGGYATLEQNSMSKFQNQIFICNLQTWTWQKPQITGSIPTNLKYFTYASNYSDLKNEIFLVGIKLQPLQNCQYSLTQNSIPKLNVPTQPLVSQKSQRSFVIIDKQIKKINNSIEQDYLADDFLYSEKNSSKIQELQYTLSQIKQTNDKLREKLQNLKSSRNQQDDRKYGTNNSNANNQLTSKLLSLLIMEHKKRRLLELKSNVLQSTIKDAQKLVIGLDYYSQEEAKIQHIRSVKQIRNSMEQIWPKQKFYKKQINSKKNSFNIDINKLFVESLGQQEAKLFTLI